MSYATLADLQNWTGTPPVAGDDRLLARASNLLDAALIASRYDVDALGNPTDAAVIVAFRDATCAQVEDWRASGNEMGDADQWEEVSLGPARLKRASGGKGGGQVGGTGSARLAPRAVEILRVANLWPGKPGLL
jgi:hypothetical protein